MILAPVLQFAVEEAHIGQGGYDSILLDLYGSGVAIVGNYQSLGIFYRIYHAESLWKHDFKPAHSMDF